MIGVIFTLVLTALILLIGGVDVPTLLAMLVTMTGSYAIGCKLRDVESRYTDWKYWVLVGFALATTVLVTCGLTYKSFWTLVTGGLYAVLSLILKAVFRFVAKRNSESSVEGSVDTTEEFVDAPEDFAEESIEESTEVSEGSVEETVEATEETVEATDTNE